MFLPISIFLKDYSCLFCRNNEGSKRGLVICDNGEIYDDEARKCTVKTGRFYYATIAYHVGLNADLGLPHPGPTS